MEFRLEPNGDFFRMGDSSGQTHRFSPFLLQEAEEGDGTILPEEWDRAAPLPAIKRIFPWGKEGAVLQPRAARIYLERIRRVRRTFFSRASWTVMLSPALLEVQGFVWSDLLRQAGYRKVQLQSSLDRLAYRGGQPECALLLHWGRAGGDLGLAFRRRILKWTRLGPCESELCATFGQLLGERLNRHLTDGESGRLFQLFGGGSLASPPGQLVEFVTFAEGQEQRHSLLQAELTQLMLRALEPILEQIESFLRQLGSTVQADLFGGGLTLSGGGVATPFLGSCLENLLEIPVACNPDGEWALVKGDADELSG